jgi:ribosomal protein S18 acetylase RimI-like enzyme
MAIRKATRNETAKILERSLIVLKEASMGYVTPKKTKAIQYTESFLSNGGYYLVCSDEKVIKGWIGLSNGMDYNTDEPIGFIAELFVLPAWRKQGIAEKLLREALLQFQKLGYDRVQLNIYAGNKAKKLYNKLGFSDVSAIMEKNINEI